jgi:hypothetical protein
MAQLSSPDFQDLLGSLLDDDPAKLLRLESTEVESGCENPMGGT